MTEIRGGDLGTVFYRDRDNSQSYEHREQFCPFMEEKQRCAVLKRKRSIRRKETLHREVNGDRVKDDERREQQSRNNRFGCSGKKTSFHGIQSADGRKSGSR